MRLFFILLLLFVLPMYSQENINIAVLDLEGAGISNSDLQGLSNRLRTELFKTGKFTVLERSRMDEILKEQGFQASACTNSECAVEIGKLIGVTKIIIGSVDKVGSIYSVDIRLVDVETGKIEKVATNDCEGCNIDKVFQNSLKIVSIMIAGLDYDPIIDTKTHSEDNNPNSFNSNTSNLNIESENLSPTLAGFSSLLPIWSGSYNEKFNLVGTGLVISKSIAILLSINHSVTGNFDSSEPDYSDSVARIGDKVYNGISEDEYFRLLREEGTKAGTYGAIALGITIIDIVYSVYRINNYNDNNQISNHNNNINLSILNPIDIYNNDLVFGLTLTYEL